MKLQFLHFIEEKISSKFRNIRAFFPFPLLFFSQISDEEYYFGILYMRKSVDMVI